MNSSPTQGSFLNAVDAPEAPEHSDIPVIQNGDLLVFGKSSKGFFANFALRVIRFFTMSDYGHVGIAVWRGNTLCVMEATVPSVVIAKLRNEGKFYFVPMNIKWKPEYEEILNNRVGLKYSVADAIRAYLGITLNKDDRWQCVELAQDVYREMGVDIQPRRLTPASFLKTVLLKGKSLYMVHASTNFKKG